MEDSVLTIQEIMELTPHRYPFLLVDKVLELEPGTRIVCLKNVTINEPFFQGHFPGYPLMPGVLIIEAMAQSAGVLALKTSNLDNKSMVFFMGIDKARFRQQVMPGDQLKMEIDVIKQRNTCWKLAGKTYVAGKLVCEAELTAMIK